MTSLSTTHQYDRPPHISVCICSFQRPHCLKRLLAELKTQETKQLFTYSIVVADNDSRRSAETVIRDFRADSSIPITYCVEPQQSIARARNKAVSNAQGEYLAFIDDDEVPTQHWLLRLFQTREQYDVDGVLGPVRRHFDQPPPRWIADSKLYERPIHPTGSTVGWFEARTGNVLLKRSLFSDAEEPFRPEFRAGEDQDFFRRQIETGRTFIWSADATVYEVVPPARWKRTYMLRKALLRGAMARLQPNCGVVSIAKSIIAVPAYAIALPASLVLGQRHFMILLIRLFDHLGKLLALVGINPMREEYVPER
jgi:glycosyltransferase involved in cell wall biosynthesis